MRLDLMLPNEGAFAVEALRAGAEFEAMGYEGLWLTDHVIGIEGFAYHTALWLEILASMAYLAARTEKVRIGAGVLVIPYRDPVITAKAVATIDLLSDGRFDLGVGTGWARREFIALGRGAFFDDRGAYTDEALDVMLTCWGGGKIEFEGRFSKFRKIEFEPHPPKGRAPLWIGARGTAKAPLRRAAKYADYWHPTGLTPQEMREGGDLLDQMAGRKVPRTARIRCDGDPKEMAERLLEYRDAGLVQVCAAFDNPLTLAELRNAAGPFIEAARKVLSD